jgi:glycosidase
MGGDLRGISDRLDYLDNLGVNLLYLTPIFWSSSNHRYDTYDYYRIDPRVGGIPELRALIDAAHRRQMRILLDGVFGHSGRGFFPFLDVMENGAASPYVDWYSIRALPVEAYAQHRYDAFQDAAPMPCLNLRNHEVRRYFRDVATHWTRTGIDGWRFDAVPHAGDRSFWMEIRDAVKHANPGAYLLGEVWGDASDWVGDGLLDGATNYELRERVLAFLSSPTASASTFASRLDELAHRHPRPVSLAMANVLGSHDTPRLWTALQGDVRRIKLALLIQFAFPGIPAVYYGDEVGLQGGEDPANRGAMEWNERRWNNEIREYVKCLISLRRTLPALRIGDWKQVHVDDRVRLIVFSRRAPNGDAIIVAHSGDRAASLSLALRRHGLDAAPCYADVIRGGTIPVVEGTLRIDAIEPWTGALLTSVREREDQRIEVVRQSLPSPGRVGRRPAQGGGHSLPCVRGGRAEAMLEE